jgi:ankyrin repeat protein
MNAQYGETPLMWAAEKGHADCARLLLNAGADKEAKSNVRRVGLPRLRLGPACDLVLVVIFVQTCNLWNDSFAGVVPLFFAFCRVLQSQ